MRIQNAQGAPKDLLHATTARQRFHRPPSSLRIGCPSASSRGRFHQPSVSLVPNSRPIVAVIEANATERNTLHSLLSALDVDVQDYDSAESYLASRIDGYGCVITDVTLPGMSGLDLLRQLRLSNEPLPIILLGEEADVSAAVTAMREGAVDFFEKPHLDAAIAKRVAYLLDHRVEVQH